MVVRCGVVGRIRGSLRILYFVARKDSGFGGLGGGGGGGGFGGGKGGGGKKGGGSGILIMALMMGKWSPIIDVSSAAD